MELAPHRIHVNLVSFGDLAKNIVHGLQSKELGLVKQLEQKALIVRTGDLQDLRGGILSLCSSMDGQW